jgi:hypothetical protein
MNNELNLNGFEHLGLKSYFEIMKQYSFKNVNNISAFCQVADQLLQQNIER